VVWLSWSSVLQSHRSTKPPNSIYPDLGYPITLFCISRSPSAWGSGRSLSFRAVA